MTQSSNRLFDEVAKLMTDAAGVAQGVGREAQTVMRAQAERFLSEMDIVKREDFEVLREMVLKLRADNDALKARVAVLEAAAAPEASAAQTETDLKDA